MWVINVIGTTDLELTGGSFPSTAGGVVYNVLGGERVINVYNTAVTGSILAPFNALNQTGGVIIGKVVVADIIFMLQINKPDCTNPPPVTLQTQTNGSVQPGDTNLPCPNSGGIVTNDTVTIGNENDVKETAVVTGTGQGYITLLNGISGSYGPGTQITTIVTNPTFSRVPPKPKTTTTTTTSKMSTTGAAATIQISFALVLAIIAFLFVMSQ